MSQLPGRAGVVTVVLGAFVFLLELVALTGLALGGWSLPGPVVVRALLAVLLPSIAVLLWGTFLSPRAPRQLPDRVRLLLRATVLAAGAVGFAAASQPVVAVLVIVSVVVATVAEPRIARLTNESR